MKTNIGSLDILTYILPAKIIKVPYTDDHGAKVSLFFYFSTNWQYAFTRTM